MKGSQLKDPPSFFTFDAICGGSCGSTQQKITPPATLHNAGPRSLRPMRNICLSTLCHGPGKPALYRDGSICIRPMKVSLVTDSDAVLRNKPETVSCRLWSVVCT